MEKLKFEKKLKKRIANFLNFFIGLKGETARHGS